MNVENGIVVRCVAGWLRRRGWIAVPPSGVGEIAGVCGVSLCGHGAGGGVSERESAVAEVLAEYPELRTPPAGIYC